MYTMYRKSYKIECRRCSGFSLMELMIAVVIVGILAAIAMSSYQSSVIRSRRSAAAACLQEGAQTMERYYTINTTYVGASMGTCSADVANFYTFSSGTPTATGFTLRAAPGTRQNDSACGTLTINQLGVRGASGTAGASQCW
ncbi:hypothetical protein CFBP2044_25040 [Xanthomonas hortorum pv. cynarae]|nr:hypothetical protein CFBP2044_25040 [Xanthomonas hortorum pv. cynarae]CAD0336448.1 hypothetical protein CFBP2044_25040 [Xanthomonas hortorum pv. cynarae]